MDVGMQLGQSQRLEQNISPQMLQSISILQKNSLELETAIKDEIEADLFDITCRRLVFLDSEALNYGDEWHAKIMEKLNECRVFI